MVDPLGYFLLAAFFGWPIFGYTTHSFYSQSRPTEGGSMRVAHAEFRPWGTDNPHFRDDLRGGMGVVLSMDREASERTSRQTGGQARCLIHSIPRNCDEGPLGRLRAMLNVFKRVDALEARMDGMEQWLGERK